jgi:acyl-CoA synthetase (NDP forming)
VVTADLCGDYGLEVPQLDQDLIADIDQILPPYWSRSNPVDLVGETDLATPIKVMELLMKWDGCDAVINLGILGRKYGVHDMIESSKKADPGQDPEFLENVRRAITDFEDQYIRRLADLMDQYQKPILGVSLVTGAEDKNVIELPDKAFNGVYFPTPERAVKALGEMCIYTDWLARR